MHTQLCISEILLFKIRSSLVLHFLFFSPIKLFFQFIPFLNSPINELNLIKFVSIFREMKHHCQWSFAQIVSICNPKMEKNLGCKKRRKEKKIQLEKMSRFFERDIQEPGHTVLGFGVIQHVQDRSMHNRTI